MTTCGGWSLIKHEGKTTSAITLWCKAWSCPDCNPYRIKALKWLAASGQPTTFITLTVNPAHGQNAASRAAELVNAWRIVVKRARRKFTKAPLEYLAVFEETKKGEPHLHILARAPFIPQKWLSNQMKALIEAPIVDIRAVTSKKLAAWYVAKYVGKGPKSFGTLKRYWHTPRYDVEAEKIAKPSTDGFGKWEVIKKPLWLLKEIFTGMHYDIEERRSDGFTATKRSDRPPNGGIVYAFTRRLWTEE